MAEYPPGYEVEAPVDLSRPVIAVPTKEPEPAVEPVPTGLVAVANVKPGTGKSVTARRLQAFFADRCENAVLWACAPCVPLPSTPSGRSLIVADTGSEPAGEWRYPVQKADLLVIPVPTGDPNAARAAGWMLDQLASSGYSQLVATAITAVIRAERSRDRRLARRVRRYFGQRTGQVVELHWTSRPQETRPWQVLGEAVLRELTAPIRSPAPRAIPPLTLQPQSL